MNTSTETKRTAQQWKRKTAMSLGRPDLVEAPDEDLEDAYDEHMGKVMKIVGGDDPFSTDPTGSLIKTGMPPGPAAVVGNEAGRRGVLNLLVNEAMSRGMNYDDAFNAILNSRPDLFKVAPGQVSNQRTSDPKTKKAENDRRAKVLALVNEKTASGMEYDAAFASVHRNNPDLFRA